MKCPRCGWKINTLSKEGATEVKTHYPKAFSPWSPDDDELLKREVRAGRDLDEICRLLGRQPTAVQRRINLFGWKPEPQKPREVNYVTGAEASAAPAPTNPADSAASH